MIFVKQGQPVAKIEKRLVRVGLVQGTAAHVIHSRLAAVPNLVAPIPEPPAEVYFFHVGEKIPIEAPHSVKRRRPDEQASPRGPEHRAVVVVLALVGFEGLKQAPPAERIPQVIEVPPGGTGVFKLGTLMMIEQFGLAGGDARMPIKQSQRSLQPVGRHFHVGVQNDVVGSLHLGQGLVVTRRKATVTTQFDDPNLRKFRTQTSQRIVGRAVVGHVHRRPG